MFSICSNEASSRDPVQRMYVRSSPNCYIRRYALVL